MNNDKLAYIAKQYSLATRLRVRPTQEVLLRETDGVLGKYFATPSPSHYLLVLSRPIVFKYLIFQLLLLADVFEAYIGALYLSEGFATTHTFLCDLLTPYAEQAYNETLADHESRVSSLLSYEEAVKSLYSMKLNRFLRKRGKRPVWWKDSPVDNPSLALDVSPSTNADTEITDNASGTTLRKGQLWKSEAWLGRVVLGTGIAPTKSKARNVAAKYALIALEEGLTPLHDRTTLADTSAGGERGIRANDVERVEAPAIEEHSEVRPAKRSKQEQKQKREVIEIVDSD